MNKIEWVDLTWEISTDTMPYPNDPSLVLTKTEKAEKDDFVLSMITTGMHLGTHVDAFSHLLPNGKNIQDIPLDRFFGPASLIRVKADAGILKTKAIRLAWDKIDSKTEILLLDTGHSRHFGTKEFYTMCPGFEPDFWHFLKENNIRLLGVDLPTVKYNEDQNATMHRDLFENDILIVESLANLEKLPDTLMFFALPLRIKEAEASLVRAMALVK